jgi:hypothetical protein
VHKVGFIYKIIQGCAVTKTLKNLFCLCAIKYRQISVALRWLLSEVTPTVLYIQFCAYQQNISCRSGDFVVPTVQSTDSMTRCNTTVSHSILQHYNSHNSILQHYNFHNSILQHYNSHSSMAVGNLACYVQFFAQNEALKCCIFSAEHPV